jgi:membrane protease YdiL (CAAX protease family)
MRAFAWFFGLLLLALAAMACLTYPLWLALHPHFGFPFHRVADRLGMVVLGLGFWAVSHRLRLDNRASLGFGLPLSRFGAEAMRSFVIGVLLMAAVVGLMVALDLRAWKPGVVIGGAAMGKIALQGLLRGIGVALIEETFLRGAMFAGIARESGAVAAIVLTSLVYALTHFVSSYHVPESQLAWRSGFDMLAGSFGAFAQPSRIVDAYLCLFAVGAVLAAVRSATGNIAASLGLHAGFVWVITFVRETSVAVDGRPLGFLLSRFDGVVGWLVCAWTVLAGFWLVRHYQRRGIRGH